ncbi:MAG TPA: hypothetical protein VJ020_05260, partial [Anaerolineales bacterium]|nr:hypothetical protein [Anaerolineales bacterium]
GEAIAYDMLSGTQAFALPPGMLSADGVHYFATATEDDETTLSVFVPNTGRLASRFALAGQWALGGISPSGRWLALARIVSDTEKEMWTQANEWRTDLQIVDSLTGAALHTLALDGNFEVETLSADGKSLFLVEHLPAVNPDHYVIRLYDLSNETLVADPLRSKGADEVMAGYAWEGLASPDGKWLLTLYLSTQRNVAFVHTLNLIDKFPVCIDLPSDGGEFDELKYYTLSLAPDGQTAYAANAVMGVVAEINLNDLTLKQAVPFAVNTPATGFDPKIQTARGLLSPEGGIFYFTSGQNVWAYDTQANTVRGPFDFEGQIAGLGLSGDGKRLFVASAGGVLAAFDTLSGVAVSLR